MVWKPKTCCLCASLRTGTLVLGWLGVICSTLPLLCLLGLAAIPREEILRICSRHTSRDNPESIACVNIVQGIFGIYGMIESITLIISILLLVGVDKNIPSLMLPYLIGRGIYITILTIVGLVAVIGLVYQELFLFAFHSFILFGGISFLSVYFFLVVCTYYKEIKQHGYTKKSNNQTPNEEEVNENQKKGQ